LRNTEGALKPESVSTKQERIAKLAAENPAMAFTSLNHYCKQASKFDQDFGLTGAEG
jgi:hypothetical protein